MALSPAANHYYMCCFEQMGPDNCQNICSLVARDYHIHHAFEARLFNRTDWDHVFCYVKMPLHPQAIWCIKMLMLPGLTLSQSLFSCAVHHANTLLL